MGIIKNTVSQLSDDDELFRFVLSDILTHTLCPCLHAISGRDFQRGEGEHRAGGSF